MGPILSSDKRLNNAMKEVMLLEHRGQQSEVTHDTPAMRGDAAAYHGPAVLIHGGRVIVSDFDALLDLGQCDQAAIFPDACIRGAGVIQENSWWLEIEVFVGGDLEWVCLLLTHFNGLSQGNNGTRKLQNGLSGGKGFSGEDAPSKRTFSHVNQSGERGRLGGVTHAACLQSRHTEIKANVRPIISWPDNFS